MLENAAIFILTQNTIERKVYLKTTLYFLFKNFNNKYRYPIIILHEGDYTERDKIEIITGIRGNCKELINFKKIDKTDFEIPAHIDKEKLEKTINTQIVPYWRNKKYRLMCNFWIKHFVKYSENYDYIMRLDDDSIIEEPITTDLFKLLKENNNVYMSNIIHIDCGICNFEMKELFQKIIPNIDNEKLDKLFVKADINNKQPIYEKIKELYKLVNNKEYDKDNIVINMPIMYYNNFFITDINFWKREDVLKIIDDIDKSGNIFYYRYGDAPLQTLIVSLLESDKITRTIFKYSKKLQRECFIDLNNNIHSYMPDDYNHSSCIIKNK
tara:strand:+ start:4036 stop:5013 length:978 start_codon:yes stop_codon:yes gene_type:complete